MTLSRFAFGFAFVSGSLLAVGACGGGGGADPIDARIDTAPGSDSGPGSDVLPPVDARPVDFGSNEGGEVRLEYIRHANGTGVGARGTAFFYKDSGTTKFWPFLDLNGCTDLSGTNGNGKWPKAQNPDGERVYYDVGSNVTAIGGPQPFVLAKNATAAKDPVGRSELANQWYSNPFTAMDSDGATFLPADTVYDIVVPGTADYAGHIYDNALYMPGDWSIDSPAFGITPIQTTAATDETYVFNNVTNHPITNPDGSTSEIQYLIAFTGANGPAVICVKKADAGAKTTITVPGAMVNVARTAYPTGGQVARQTVSHTVRELVNETGAPTGKRIDFLGVWCYAGQTYLSTP
ncbi:MAG TPA: hypothetical protein VGM90_31020 [Kofleriaceae bacterium]|jgi:hypothetical protein